MLEGRTFKLDISIQIWALSTSATCWRCPNLDSWPSGVGPLIDRESRDPQSLISDAAGLA